LYYGRVTVNTRASGMQGDVRGDYQCHGALEHVIDESTRFIIA